MADTYTEMIGAVLTKSRRIAAGDINSGRSGMARAVAHSGSATGQLVDGGYDESGDLMGYFTFGDATRGFGNSVFMP